ncbi:hypothetical protein PF010_g32869 [Phytophthora fragariae]|uniref:Uncharacterized protein n=1 Tax=Phytophthora fragariae TaxID=53985 RepID=A0A6G0JE49_9STRA|nr:hypothetical protein PF010_g32869 [Phytophthora fragariae]KAE9160752.1 hypothetical protein PF004_g31066 [Phytophthora fragariae]
MLVVTAARASSSALRSGTAIPPSFLGNIATCSLSQALPATCSSVNLACQIKF